MRAACVWLDTATQRYALTVLDGGVRWRAPGAAAIPTAIRSGTTLPGLIATATHPDCDHDAAHLAAYATTRADPAAPTTLLVAPE